MAVVKEWLRLARHTSLGLALVAVACAQDSDATESRLTRDMRAAGLKIEASRVTEHAEALQRGISQLLEDLHTIDTQTDWKSCKATGKYWDVYNSLDQLRQLTGDPEEAITAWRESPYSLEATWLLDFGLHPLCRHKSTVEQMIDICPGVTREPLTQIGKQPDFCTTAARRHFRHLLYLISWYDAEGIPSNPGKHIQ